MTDVSAIILVGEEELHIKRCLERLRDLNPRQIFVVESQRGDRTHELAIEAAKQLNWCVNDLTQDRSDVVVQTSGITEERRHTSWVETPVCAEGTCVLNLIWHDWPGLQSAQFNWALDSLSIEGKWILRLDADEYLSSGLIEEIKAKLASLPEDVTGVAFHLRRVFMGRVIRRGMPRIKMIRLFRFGKARCEQRLMDEHIELQEGRSVEFAGDFADHNLNDIGWWTAKHNGYALREAVDLLDLEYGILEGSNAADAAGSKVQTRLTPLAQKGSEAAGKPTLELPSKLDGQAAEKRRKKMRYARMPLFWRAFAYFCYRYFLRGGFLEGKAGFLWHFLQGWWYRTLVDAKIFEIKHESGGDREKMLALLRGKYGMKI